ncbi:MAG TPA: phosphatase PAP2 family protein [Gemmatimonadales bacterium]|nr:phosphatase PAP2 family protein [Gemmatimonadales bacterium]
MSRVILSVLVLLSSTAPLAAQQPADSTAPASPPPAAADSTAFRPHPLHAWEVGAVAALGALTIAVVDEPAREWAQDPAHRSGTADDVADVVRVFGQWSGVLVVTGGLVGTGLVAHQPKILHAGLRVGASVLVSGVVTQGAKWAFGRTRPDSTDDEWEFQPFSGNESMWSGHSAFAFAMATSLSQDIDRPWATVGLYTLATATAWSRVYDNKHWVSDVVVGAAAGIVGAKLATGRWTLFGLRAPVPLATGGRVGLMWSGTF